MEGYAADIGLLVLRLAGVGLAYAHGRGKVMGLAAGKGEGIVRLTAAMGFPRPRLFAWASGLAELLGGVSVALGLFTRGAAIVACSTLLVAVFGHHRAHRHLSSLFGGGPAGREPVADPCGLELAVLYLFVFVGLSLTGGGRLSLDHWLGLPKLLPW